MSFERVYWPYGSSPLLKLMQEHVGHYRKPSTELDIVIESDPRSAAASILVTSREFHFRTLNPRMLTVIDKTYYMWMLTHVYLRTLSPLFKKSIIEFYLLFSCQFTVGHCGCGFVYEVQKHTLCSWLTNRLHISQWTYICSRIRNVRRWLTSRKRV